MTKFQDNVKELLPIMRRVESDGFRVFHGFVWEKKELWEPAAKRICAIEDYPRLTKHIVTEFWEGKKASEKVYLSEEEAVKAYYASGSGHVWLEREEGGKRKNMLSRFGKIELANVI